jgi:hypothetical protein
VAAALFAATSLAACAYPFAAEAPTYREMLESYQAQNPESEFVVPVGLPSGYRMMSPWEYLPLDPGGGKPVIAVCVLDDAQAVLGTCVGTEDSSPWFETDSDGPRVVVQTMSVPETQAALAPWRDVVFTSDWENLAWLDQSSAVRGRG